MMIVLLLCSNRLHGCVQRQKIEVVNSSTSEIKCRGVARLIKSDASATGQSNCGCHAPAGLNNLRRLSAVALEDCDGLPEIIAHEVEHAAGELMIRMALNEVSITGMNAKFGRRQSEDQPTLT